MRYSILDPTGNITALVEDKVDVSQQPIVAEQIMRRHHEVEQVGFVEFFPSEAVQVSLRMAGGEFCGNATMSAAALFAHCACWTTDVVRLTVSGTRNPVEVRLEPMSDDCYRTTISMPPAIGIQDVPLTVDGSSALVPIVRMEGISHAIITSKNVHFALLQQRKRAERVVRKWCDVLEYDGLGLMFLDQHMDSYYLTPLVHIPGSNTVFWEHSCASGSAAVGAYLSFIAHSPIDAMLHEPGGDLSVQSDWSENTTSLHGSVSLI